MAPLIGQGQDLHALHLGTRGVVAEGGCRSEQSVTGLTVGMKDGMNRSVHTVEQAHLVRVQWSSQSNAAEVGNQRLSQTVVFGINGDLFGGDPTQGLQHPWAGADGVLIEIQTQQITATLQGCAVGLEMLHLRTSCGCSPGQLCIVSFRGVGSFRRVCRLHHIRSRTGRPSRSRPTLRLSAGKGAL